MAGPRRSPCGRSEGVTKVPASTHSAYLVERRRETLVRLQQSAPIALAAIAGAILMHLLVVSDHLRVRLMAFGIEWGVSLVVVLAVRGRRAERWAIPLAIGYIGTVGAMLFALMSLVPADLDVLVGSVDTTMITAALVLPWGALAQGIVAGGFAAGYAVLVHWSALDASRRVNVLVSLATAAGVSVFGALVLDRHRRATFVEREQSRAAARQRELLLDAGRELNGTLALDALLGAIARVGRELVGCDTVTLTLIDERQANARIAAHCGELDDDKTEAIVGLEFPTTEVAALVSHLSSRHVMEFPEDLEPGDDSGVVLRRWGVARTLCVAIEREGWVLGYLNFNQWRDGGRFAEQQVRLALGLAHQSAVALANARLVEQLRTASRIKTEFVSTMSHELRTPLNVIMGYTEMILEMPARELPELVKRIRVASRELLELVEATLNLNRLESGRDMAELEPMPLAPLWQELEEEFAALPRRPEVALRWTAVGDVLLLTDRRKLKIIVKNLVGNALKFTSTGEVAVRVAVTGNTCAIEVHDTGVGIAPEHLSSIFEMFRQVDSSDRRSYGGVGLGLYIVRRLVDQLVGDVTVASRPGEGTTFTVTLPLAAATAGDGSPDVRGAA